LEISAALQTTEGRLAQQGTAKNPRAKQDALLTFFFQWRGRRDYRATNSCISTLNTEVRYEV